MEKDGSKIGQIWAKLKDDDAVKPLTAILTLNTIAHTMGAAGVGSEVNKQFGEHTHGRSRGINGSTSPLMKSAPSIRVLRSG